MKSVLTALNWRYATDKFLDQPMPEETFQTILQAARLAPSSMNFQPWKYILVQSAELKEQIFEAGYRQEAIKAPHLLALIVPNLLNTDNVNQVIQATAKARQTDPSNLEGYRNMLQGFVDKTSPDKFIDWNKRQAYISLGMLLLTAAQLEIDAAPMEGFNSEQVKAILGLSDYTAITLIGLGYRHPEDSHQSWPKVRFELEQMFEAR